MLLEGLSQAGNEKVRRHCLPWDVPVLLPRENKASPHSPSTSPLPSPPPRVNHAMKLGLKVGLGTDVAGGISPSMLTSIRMAVVNSRCLRAHKLAVKGGYEVTPDMEVRRKCGSVGGGMAVVNSRCLRAHKLAVEGGYEVTPDMEVRRKCGSVGGGMAVWMVG